MPRPKADVAANMASPDLLDHPPAASDVGLRARRLQAAHEAFLLTAFFFLMPLFMPILGHVDRIGEPWTLPNANAPAAGAHDEH